MSKIGDLFIRLGLRKKEFSDGIKQAGSEISGFGKLTSMVTKAATSAWAAIGLAIGKFATDAIKMTQKWGDEWQITMAGVKGAYGTFIRQLSSGEGFDNLFANMRESYRLAKEVASAMDEIFERKNSYSYLEADINRQIAELDLIRRDTSKSDAEREDASRQIIELEKQLGEEKKKIAVDEAKYAREMAMDQTKLNSDQLDFMVKEYRNNRDVINQAREYLATRERINKELATYGGSRGSRTDEQWETMQRQAEMAKQRSRDLEASTSDSVKAVANLVKGYDRANDELISGLVAADVAVVNIETDALRAQGRATSTLGSLNKETGGVGNTDRASDQAAAVLRRAQDAAKSEIQLLTEKYMEEKALLERYGMDTVALTKEYLGKVDEEIKNGLDVALEDIENLEPVEIEPFEFDDSELEEFINDLYDANQKAIDIAREFGDNVAGGFSDACQQMMDAFFGLDDINAGMIVQSLLTPLADMAVKAGEVIVAEGIAVDAAKKALVDFFGGGAIVAGAALIAAGTAAKAGLAAIARSGSASSSTSTYQGGSSSLGNQNIQTELTVTVKGELRGRDIVLAGQNTLNSWGR